MKTIGSDAIGALARALAEKGWRVAAPLADGELVRWNPWNPEARVRLDFPSFPVNSLKDFLFPRSEIIDAYDLDGNDFKPRPMEPTAPKTVVLAARPCEAAVLPLLDAVFNWDYKDAFYNARRAATTVVTLICTAADEQCFCTSVGGSPDSIAGADAVLRPADAGRRFVCEPLNEKGRELLSAADKALSGAQATCDPVAQVPKRFDSRVVGDWLDGNFESPVWKEASRPCLGCGACAYACPSCHCFDMQDETWRGESLRYRNWDSCGFGLFTLHAGGHNPRADQSARWRQRVMHKFSIFPKRFRTVSCTGCGRCARLCPAGMSMSETCERIAAQANARTEAIAADCKEMVEPLRRTP